MNENLSTRRPVLLFIKGIALLALGIIWLIVDFSILVGATDSIAPNFLMYLTDWISPVTKICTFTLVVLGVLLSVVGVVWAFMIEFVWKRKEANQRMKTDQ